MAVLVNQYIYLKSNVNGDTIGFMTSPQETDRLLSDGGEFMEEAPTTPARVYAIAEVVQAFQSRKTRLLTEEKVEIMVAKRSAKIAKRDPRMLNDIRAMIASIRQEPRGLGTEVLTEKAILIGHRTFSLYSLNPGRRPDLSLTHKLAHRVRVVYAIDGSNGQPIVILEGIYMHDKFDKKFGGRRFGS